MSFDRITDILNNRRKESIESNVNLDGFVTNPLANGLTPGQIQMYHAAYMQASNQNAEPDWPLAEYWN